MKQNKLLHLKPLTLILNSCLLIIVHIVLFFLASELKAQIYFGPQQVITTLAKGAQSVYSADIDGDGDQDVLSASNGDHKIAWYENADGNGNFGAQQIITTSALEANSVYAADFDGDGDLDVLSASYNVIAWYENTDGNGTFGKQNVISISPQFSETIFASDLDGDGDQDVLASSKDYGAPEGIITWHENTDGNGTFGEQQVIDSLPGGSVKTSDLDGDGDQDVLSVYGAAINWYENIDGNGTFGPPHIIQSCGYSRSLFTTDIDNDGDQDILVATDVLTGADCLLWCENIDGNGTFETHDVSPASWDGNYNDVHAADLDMDGDQDVLSAQGQNNSITWYENTDGNGTFGDQQVITTLAGGAGSVFAADLDGDGDQDVLSASSYDNKIAWFENLPDLSVQQLFQDGILIYPNPSNGTLKINFSNNDIRKIAISEITGKIVIEKTQIQREEKYDLSGLESGIYIVSIHLDYGVFTSKIIKL
jgi:hypothetical protein